MSGIYRSVSLTSGELFVIAGQEGARYSLSLVFETVRDLHNLERTIDHEMTGCQSANLITSRAWTNIEGEF